MFKRNLVRSCLSWTTIALLTACSGGTRPVTREQGLGGSGSTPGQPMSPSSPQSGEASEAQFTSNPPRPVAIESTRGCSEDDDCASGMYCFVDTCAYECQIASDCGSGASCDVRGHCSNGAAPSTVDVGFVDQTSDVPVPQDNRTTLGLKVDLTGTPSAPIPYLLFRDDLPRDITQQKIAGRLSAQSNTLTIAKGDADPTKGDAARAVSLTLVTPLGRASFVLRPVRTPGTGRYVGEIKQGTFGKFGPALDFDIIVTGSGLSRAVYLRMPVGAGYVFSPKGADAAEGSYVTRKLTFESGTRLWVGAFEYKFALPATSAWAGQGLQVNRSIRIELNNDSLTRETLSGTIADRWNGIYRRFVNQAEEEARIEYSGTFEARRVDDRIAATAPTETPNETPAPLPALVAPLTECTDSVFASLGCTGLGSPSAFELANASAQATCAKAAVDTALTTSLSKTMIGHLDGTCTGGACGSPSFKAFVNRCKDESDPLCGRNAKALCARQLTAYAALKASQADYADLMTRYGDVTREVTFAHQMRAFGRDNDLRLEWLRSTEFPGFVANVAREYTKGLLKSWDEGVVGQHLSALQIHFDRSALAILGRIPANAPTAVEDGRRRIVAEMTQTWQGAIDAMTTSVNRWNVVLAGTVERSTKAAEVTARLRDLYTYAGIVSTINRYASDQVRNAALGTSLSTFLPALERLASSQDALIYARDAEVVLSTSLDPTNGQDTVLRLRRQSALEAVSLAESSIDQVLERADAEALSEQQLFSRLDNEVDQVRRQLIELCGVPVGCDLFNLDNPACRVDTRAGRCGLVSYDGQTYRIAEGGESGSDAARALLRIEDAKYGVSLAQDELDTQLKRSELMLGEIGAFARDIEEWNLARQEGVVATSSMMNEVLKSRRQSVRVMAQGIAERETIRRKGIAERAQIRNEQRAIKVQLGELTQAQFDREKAVREEMVKRARQNIDKWDRMRVGNAETDFLSVVEEQSLRAASRAAQFGQALADDLAAVAVSATPTFMGDAGGSVRSTALGAAASEKAALRGAAEAAELGADAVAAARQRTQALASAELVQMQEQAQLDDTIDQNELESIRAEIAIDREARQLALDDLYDASQQSLENEALALAVSEGRTQLSQAELDLYIEKLQNVEQRRQMQQDADLSYKRDLASLREKRQQLLEMLQSNAGLQLRIERARLNVLQALADYMNVVLRARQTDAQLEVLLAQRDRVNEIVGSPSMVFRRSNALRRAEDALERAKGELMDWLVALEYYAVRPFMDHRIALLFSTSPHQLRNIAAELSRIEEDCGGVVNTARATVSVRNTLLDRGGYSVDPASELVSDPAERFRTALLETEPPSRITARYRTDATVGDLFTRRDELLAATFSIDLGDFANLPAVCNAKVSSVAVKLIGDLGSGVSPTVSLLYDGTSTLKSCQADIRSVVSNFGGATAFGEVTKMRTEPRVVSPVAGVNTFPPDHNRSRTLEGLPLASQYTVMIDTMLGENDEIDWGELQDIELSIEYTFQDVFVESSCY